MHHVGFSQDFRRFFRRRSERLASKGGILKENMAFVFPISFLTIARNPQNTRAMTTNAKHTPPTTSNHSTLEIRDIVAIILNHMKNIALKCKLFSDFSFHNLIS